MPRKKELSFEESLTELERIVTAMESGDSSLKELMANYSEGVKLGTHCFQVLNRAEKAMDLLIDESAELATAKKLKIEGDEQ